MRIISGLYKGRIIKAPKNISVRPTTNRAKEALFNILCNNFEFEKILALDLFCGIGSISFELSSRGTKSVTAIDNNPLCINFINNLNDKLKMEIRTIKTNVFSFLKKTKNKYDFIFADPPFNLNYSDYLEIINIIFSSNILPENGLLVIEHSKRYHFNQIKFFDQSRFYGNNTFSFFKKRQAYKPDSV